MLLIFTFAMSEDAPVGTEAHGKIAVLSNEELAKRYVAEEWSPYEWEDAERRLLIRFVYQFAGKDLT